MSKLRFTVRSILNQLNNLILNFIIPALLIIGGPVLFFSSAHASVKIAVIDTGFCPAMIKGARSLTIHPVLDLTQTAHTDCQKPDLKSPRLHGQRVLQEFLTTLKTQKTSYEIFPMVIFDGKGDQKREYWLQAIDRVRDLQVDLVVTAAGLITSKDELKLLPTLLPALWFVPSGRIGPGLKETTILFPQALAPQKNLFVIGDYYDGKMVMSDAGLLYKDKIDFYFPSGRGSFTGTSRAVAQAAATALNLCGLQDMRSCLDKQSKIYIDGFSQKKIKTY